MRSLLVKLFCREHDAGLLMIGHTVNAAQLVPPNTPEFVTVGHCHPECTGRFPAQGLQVFNVLLHSHLSGKGEEKLVLIGIMTGFNKFGYF